MRVRALGALALLTLAAPAGAASYPPHLRFRSLSTDRITVLYHQGLEDMARETAALAAEILDRHEARYLYRVGRVRIVLADVEDDPNGYASPFPYPVVSVRAVAPTGSDEFGNYDNWLRLLLTHELAHTVHLDQARGALSVYRKIFGRAPLYFPIFPGFPNLLTPTWMVEGLATYEETKGTAFGRGRNPDSHMIVRMAALEETFPREDQAAPVGPDLWPGGQTPYLFGESFFRDLTARAGERTLPELAWVHAGRVIPFLDDRTSSMVTGMSFHEQWKLWSASVAAQAKAEGERRRSGLTASRALTSRGIRQLAPRFSPDGAWIAYTSRSLTRFPAIRLVRPDGTGDRELVRRNGSTGLSWTPDGRRIVYDETEVYRFFSERSDLRTVEVGSRRVKRLTRGLRAREPDVSPDGQTVVFARQEKDRSELWTIGLDGTGLRQLTHSAPGTQWGGPRWSPRGDRIAASRWGTGGWLDVVEIDPATGAAVNLTEDRAKDVEPTWTPDGGFVVFRSDRDGISNLYALRRADGALLRLTSVLGGSFAPAVDPEGTQVVFSNYSARGYDVHVASLDLDAAAPAEPFVDPYPAPLPAPAPLAAEPRRYQPWRALLPRFWTPIYQTSGDERQYGAATAGAEPLLRHAYGLELYYGDLSNRMNGRLFYQYDRFWPTFLVAAEDTTDVTEEGEPRTRSLSLRASVPVKRTVRSSQSLSLTWRRERETLVGGEAPTTLDLGGLEAAWTLSTVKEYPLSISPTDGVRVRVAYLREDPAFGSDLSLAKITGDVRTYTRLFGERDVLAVRLQGGATVGEPDFTRSFAVGGFPDSELFDLASTNLAVLRGYPDDAFRGRNFAGFNFEYRFPLATPERGWRSLPLFLRHLHGSVFFDAADAWNGAFQIHDVKTAAGIAVGANVTVSHIVRLTGTGGVARGFGDKGETRAYFRLGLAF